MKNFELGAWRLSRIILLFFYSSITFSMEKPEVLSIKRQNVELMPKQTIAMFDFKTEAKNRKLWSEIAPQNLIVTPDEKGVIVIYHGHVRYASLDTGISKVIIKHQCLKNVPLVAVSQPKKESLVVVSVCNYYSEPENKYCAEYAVYSDGFSKFRYVDFPIQAISLNHSGNMLAIADLSSVVLIDLDTQKEYKATFQNRLDPENWIVDIVMNPKGTGLMVIGNKKEIQWMMHYGDLQNLKQWKSEDKIKEIYYPSAEELLYLTEHGQTKLVKVGELFEKDNNQLIAGIPFANSSKYENVAVDLGEQIAVAYWTKDIKILREVRQKIKVYHDNTPYRNDDEERCINGFILKFPDLEESYNYMTSSGTLVSGINHLLHVALRGKTVVALATDGKMRVWSLIEQSKSSPESPVVTTREVRGRSDSTKILPLVGSSGGENDRISSVKSNSKNSRNWSFVSGRRSPSGGTSSPKSYHRNEKEVRIENNASAQHIPESPHRLNEKEIITNNNNG